MFTRVLEVNGGHVPQQRGWFGKWCEITDTIREEELESSDDYDSDFDSKISAENCARRFAAAGGGYYTGHEPERVSWRQKIREYFRGPAGYPGACGPMGLQGEPGRNFDDLQCPHCKKFRTDHPSQQLLLEVIDENVFQYNCVKCGRNSIWLNFQGLLLSELSVKRKEAACPVNQDLV